MSCRFDDDASYSTSLCTSRSLGQPVTRFITANACSCLQWPQAMTEALGWPSVSAHERDPNAGAHAHNAELRLQLTTLQLVSGCDIAAPARSASCVQCAGVAATVEEAPSLASTQQHCPLQVGLTVRRDSAALQGFQDAGGFSRITSLLQWAALACGGTVEISEEPDSTMQPSQQDAPAAPAADAAASTATGAADSQSAGQPGSSDRVLAPGSSPFAAPAPAAAADAPGNPFEGPRLPPLPSPVRTPAGSRRLGSGNVGSDGPPGSPLAHKSPLALHRLDSARVRVDFV